jgi:predicted transcriptional regulator
MYQTVGQLLQGKGTQVWSVKPETTVYDALVLMADKDIGALVVCEQNKVDGIFTERDYARKCILKGKHSQSTAVKELMSAAVVVVGPQETIENCMKLMTAKHARHLPVLENGQLVGIVSIGDIVKATITGHEFTIEQLQRYITGS